MYVFTRGHRRRAQGRVQCIRPPARPAVPGPHVRELRLQPRYVERRRAPLARPARLCPPFQPPAVIAGPHIWHLRPRYVERRRAPLSRPVRLPSFPNPPTPPPPPAWWPARAKPVFRLLPSRRDPKHRAGGITLFGSEGIPASSFADRNATKRLQVVRVQPRRNRAHTLGWVSTPKPRAELVQPPATQRHATRRLQVVPRRPVRRLPGGITTYYSEGFSERHAARVLRMVPWQAPHRPRGLRRTILLAVPKPPEAGRHGVRLIRVASLYEPRHGFGRVRQWHPPLPSPPRHMEHRILQPPTYRSRHRMQKVRGVPRMFWQASWAVPTIVSAVEDWLLHHRRRRRTPR